MVWNALDSCVNTLVSVAISPQVSGVQTSQKLVLPLYDLKWALSGKPFVILELDVGVVMGNEGHHTG